MSGRGSRPTACPSGRPVLPQGEVERGALERPAAVVDVGVLLGLGSRRAAASRGARENESIVQVPASGSTGTALELRVVLARLVRDVLAEALLARAREADRRRLAREAARDVERADLEAVALDLERELVDGVVEAHRAANATDTSAASRAFATMSLRLTSRVRPSECSCRYASTNGVRAWPETPCARRRGDGLLDQVVDLDALGRRVREEEAAAAELPVRGCRSGRPSPASSTRCGIGGPPVAE